MVIEKEMVNNLAQKFPNRGPKVAVTPSQYIHYSSQNEKGQTNAASFHKA